MGSKSTDGLNQQKERRSREKVPSCSYDNESEDEDFKPKRSSTQSKREQSTIASQNLKKGASKSSKRVLKSKGSTSGGSAGKSHEGADETLDTQDVRKENPNIAVKEDPLLSESIVPHKNKNNKSDSDVAGETNKSLCKANASSLRSSEFCPICQVPLNVLKISAAMHTSSCIVPPDSLACPQGNACLNSNMFHYRDFSHHELAAFRISEEYIEPDVIFTPQKGKLKRTPIRTSAGRKRPSKSPLASSSKLPRQDGNSCSKDSPVGSPDMFHEENHPDEPRKRLFSEDVTDVEPNDHKEHNNLSPAGFIQSDTDLCVETATDQQQNSEGLDSLVQSELWCSDLILSESTLQQEIAPSFADGTSGFKIKSEPKSQDNLEENVVVPAASSAQVTIHYDKALNDNDQELSTTQIDCSESCRQESNEVLQANCSVLIKATGVNRKEAMARSPLSVTLMVNSSGWEALEIKGNCSTNVHKIEVSVCQCSHSMCVGCSVNSGAISEDVKFQLEGEPEEKFFSTLGDMGLKRQQLSVPHFRSNDRKNFLLKNCNQITVSTAIENTGSASNENDVSSEISHERDCENTVSEEPVKVVDAFALLKKTAMSKRCPTPTAPLFSSEGRSRPSTPTMVVSKSSGSSWTLIPAAETRGPAGARTYGTVSKKVPAYKRIPDTQFVVDAFNYGVIPGAKIYFLSHFHSDHYTGLRKDFNLPIYCSQVTANLVHLKIRVDKRYLNILKIGEPRVICGVEVEVYDANHCPGALMILFRLLDGRSFLHVGDFRAHPCMEEHTQLINVDKLYLDTTYCDPAYDFPYQEEVVEKVVQTVKHHFLKSKSTLIVCGTYTIGKEKVFMGIAEAFDLKIWTTGDKRKVLNCLEDKNISDRLTTDPFAAQIHVLAMRDIALEELLQHLNKYNRKYTHIVGFKPTGWTTSTSLKGKPSDFQKSSRDKVTIYGVPYSEHSSFSELRRFVRYVRPKDIQVTVNVGKSAQYKKLFQQWLSSNKDGNGQSKVVQYFSTSSRESLC